MSDKNSRNLFTRKDKKRSSGTDDSDQEAEQLAQSSPLARAASESQKELQKTIASSSRTASQAVRIEPPESPNVSPQLSANEEEDFIRASRAKTRQRRKIIQSIRDLDKLDDSSDESIDVMPPEYMKTKRMIKAKDNFSYSSSSSLVQSSSEEIVQELRQSLQTLRDARGRDTRRSRRSSLSSDDEYKIPPNSPVDGSAPEAERSRSPRHVTFNENLVQYHSDVSISGLDTPKEPLDPSKLIPLGEEHEPHGTRSQAQLPPPPSRGILKRYDNSPEGGKRTHDDEDD